MLLSWISNRISEQLHDLIVFSWVFLSRLLRKGAGGAAGHSWPDSQGDRPGHVQVWSVRRQGHREVVQRWSGGVAKRAHQNDSHRKVRKEACVQNKIGFKKKLKSDTFLPFCPTSCCVILARFHRLVIDNVKPEDAGDYTFVPDGYALSLSAKLNFLGEEDGNFSKLPGVHVIYFKCRLISSNSFLLSHPRN